MIEKPDPANDAAPGITNSFAPLRSQRFAKVDDAYQEYCRRTEAGEVLDPETYCDQFPSIRSSLCQLIQLHEFIDDNPSLLFNIEPVDWPAVNTMFLDYHLRCELGRGGFSRVYLAHEGKLGNRLVAVKITEHTNSEAHILGPISHPNIVPVHSVQEDRARRLSLVCMPYAGSTTLNDVIDRVRAEKRIPGKAEIFLETARQLPVPLEATAQPQHPSVVLEKGSYIDGVRWIGAAIADALAHVHAAGICHRDLKPSNVLLSPSGSPMLLDFNLAAHVRETLAPIGGTLPYMAPEQLRTLGAAGPTTEAPDARADLFALGVILYELATGRHPFEPIPIKLEFESFSKELLRRQTAGTVPAYEVNPAVDRALSDLIQQCLAVNPKARPQTAAEIATALRRGITRPALQPRWTARYRIKTWAASAALLALTIVLPLVVGTRQAVGEPPLTTGTELCRKGKYHDAVPYLTSALLADPKNEQILVMRACAYVHLGEYMLARQDFERADSMAPRGHSYAGIAYTYDMETAKGKRPKYAAAEMYYLKAIEHGFATPEVRNNQAYNHRKQNNEWTRIASARETLNEVLKANPGLQAAYYNRAVITYGLVLRDKAAVKEWMVNPTRQLMELPEQAKTPADLLNRAKAGLADVQDALKAGPVSADLHFLAARIYAAGSPFNKTWIDRMFEELELARDHGLDLARNKDATFQAFQNDPRFAKIIAKAPTHAYVPASFTVNPVQRIAE